MRVSNALLARYAEYDEGSDTLTIVGGGVDVFGTPELPIEFSQPFALQMRFAEEEADREFQIGMEILGPNLDTIGMPTTFAITPKLGPYHVPKWEGVISVAGTVRLYAIQAGIHSVSIVIEGQRAGGIPFQIVHLTGDEEADEE